MSNFFDSKIIRNELEDIYDIQKELYYSIAKFSAMDDEDKKLHICKLKELLEKQEIMYARLSLSDDPEAKEMKEKITIASEAMGFQELDMSVIFKNMRKTLESLEKRLDNA
jgi:hypothetical protein